MAVERTVTILVWIVSAGFLLVLAGCVATVLLNMRDAVRLFRAREPRMHPRPEPEILARPEPGAERYRM